MRDLSDFPQRLSKVMTKQGITQAELAKKIGVTQQSVSCWIRGINQPEYSTLLRVCFHLDIDPNYLLGFDSLNEKDFQIDDDNQ